MKPGVNYSTGFVLSLLCGKTLQLATSLEKNGGLRYTLPAPPLRCLYFCPRTKRVVFSLADFVLLPGRGAHVN